MVSLITYNFRGKQNPIINRTNGHKFRTLENYFSLKKEEIKSLKPPFSGIFYVL